MSKGFRVTVEDLNNGDKQVAIIQEGGYVLIPFLPCRLAKAETLEDGTVRLELKNHAPAGPSVIGERQ